MKTTIKIISVGLVLFLLTGCNKKQPEFTEDGTGNVSDVAKIAGETVTIDNDAFKNRDNTSITDSMSNTNGSKFNSSSDGFQSIYFAFGKYDISENMDNNILTNVQVLNHANGKIKIEGNCDEFGTDEYNYALGLKRAKAVKDILVSQGINANRIVLISLGESNPVCSEASEECYSRNRRVDLRLIK